MSKIMYNDRAYGEIIGSGASILPFIGTDGTDPGVTGLVPAPSTSDMNKFLKSDGTWGIPTGGAGGTSDYEELINLPSINNHTLLGSMSLSQLGLIDFFYPIGSYYETSDADFDPSTEWGGTWTLVSSKDAYVVDGGTSGDWTYRKWSDGTSECWLKYTESTAQEFSPSGSFFYRNIQGLNFPSGSFVATPTLQASMQMGNVGAIEISSVANTYCAVTIMSAVSTARAVTLHLYAIGRWSNTSETYYRWHRTA